MGGRKVLVAEDQSVNWMLVERLLVNRGHSACNAVNGRQALEMLESEEYDLVLMDCQMPLIDGYSAAREIRRRELGTGAHTPIVAMTANAMEGDRELCLQAGMDDYLSKPITSAAVDEVLSRWLPDGKAAASELDPRRIEELRSLFSAQEIGAMFMKLQREVDLQLHRIGTALEQGKGNEAADAAHRILSSARMIGAEGLIDAATLLQESARRDPEQAREAEERVREEWESARTALETELLGRV